jgi:hypothetical protein
VQVDPIKPTLKAPGIKPLKLKYDELLSSFAFKFNLRRYTMADSRLTQAAMDCDLGASVAARVAFHGRGLHSFPFPLNLSSLCPCPLNLSLHSAPYIPDVNVSRRCSSSALT